MFKMNGCFVSAALGCLSVLGMSAAKADDAHCYTVADFKGAYAVVGHYQGDSAIAIGERYLDGEGNLTGTFILNEAVQGSTTGARKIVTGTQKGTYTVNCNGTGVITRVVTASNGTTATQIDDFVVTKATVKWGHLRVTAIQDVQETASLLVPGGLLLSRTWTRIPGTDPAEDATQ
jgi:hypothetical protein